MCFHPSKIKLPSEFRWSWREGLERQDHTCPGVDNSRASVAMLVSPDSSRLFPGILCAKAIEVGAGYELEQKSNIGILHYYRYVHPVPIWWAKASANRTCRIKRWYPSSKLLGLDTIQGQARGPSPLLLQGRTTVCCIPQSLAAGLTRLVVWAPTRLCLPRRVVTGP